MGFDTSVYPDRDDVPISLTTDWERADYVKRICDAWDYGIIPLPDTFALFATWRAVFDRFPLRHSPAYAAFRMRFGWPPMPVTVLEARWERMDRRAGRSLPDPCRDLA